MPIEDHNEIPTECLGVTGAVNFAKPERHEIMLTQQLELAIQNLNIFESDEEIKQRKEALVELQDFCNEWIYRKAIDYMYPESVAKSIKGKLFTFGSYRLGVNFSGADIDALLVGPKFISRDDFFEDFVPFLVNNPMAAEIHAVPKAFVPVLKMKFCGIEIDLLFASVDLMSIPDNFCLLENSDQLLRNMDERDVRSVNGVRVTDDILRLVYDKNVFKSALKIIRIWAKRRCIYSNAMGFLGGVSWAILVARICQLWPMASVSVVVINFFKFYGTKWRWPSPVMLKEVEELSVLHLVQWDPRVNASDQNHVMPILTPSYPSQNSTYNVCESHKRFIIDQMKSAHRVIYQIMRKEKKFPDLFKPLFFFNYRHYLVVKFRCTDKRQYREDSSLIESKLRLLVQYLESNMFVEFALLYLRSYDRMAVEGENGMSNHEVAGSDTAQDEDDKFFVRRWIIGLELRKLEQNLYLVDEISRFKNFVKVDVDVSHATRRKLTEFLSQDDIDKLNHKLQQAKCRKRSSESSSAACDDSNSSTAANQTAPVMGPVGDIVAVLEDQSHQQQTPPALEPPAAKSLKLDDVTSSSTVVAKCSSTEEEEVASRPSGGISVVSSTTEKETADTAQHVNNGSSNSSSSNNTNNSNGDAD